MSRARQARAAEPGDPLVFAPAANPDMSAGSLLGPADVELAQRGEELVNGAAVTENPDGSVDIDLDPSAPPPMNASSPEAKVHDANLAAFLGANELNGIASKLVEQIEADWKSSEDWRNQTAEAIKLLGVKIETKNYPFKDACAVTDPLMLEALIRFQATARGELLPPQGPAKTAVVGETTPQTEDKAARVQMWLNYYLTEQAPEYYPEYDQMLFWCGLVGSTFKKVYQDPLMRRPVAPYLTADDLIVPYSTTNLATAPRVTHKISMHRRDVLALQLSGVYVKETLPEQDETQNVTTIKAATDNAEGRTPDTADNDNRVVVYESHVDLDIPGFKHVDDKGVETGLPLPYRVTVEKESRKILAIYRNWKEGDTRYRKRNYFVHYKYLPGLGFYGFGLCHIVGQQTKAATTILRQLIDAGTLVSFPGGLRAKGVRMTRNNILIGPTEFAEVDTGGLPLEQAVKPLPYREPSQQLRELRQQVVEDARRVASTSEIAVGDGRQDAPVGTTMALLEAATRVESGTIRRIHAAMREELRLFAELFGEFLPDAPYPFPVPGGMQAIMRADFGNQVDVFPVSDPNYGSQTQRLVKAEARLRLASENPGIHNMRELYRDVYHAMNIDPTRISAILPEPQQAVPLDPLSENMNAIRGLPLAVGPAQDHDAHIAAHQAIAQQAPSLMAHIAEHMAQALRNKVQLVLGIQLPPPGTQLPPDVENELAGLVAKAMEVVKQQSGAPGTATNPEMVAIMGELNARAQQTAAKMKDSADRNQVQLYKINTDAQLKREQMASDERIEGLKAFASTADNLRAPRPEATQILNATGGIG